LRGGFEDNLDTQEKIHKNDRKMKHEDLKLIVETLKAHPVFYALSDQDLESIVRAMFYCEVSADEFVF
jgi:hypothetical protein